MTITKSPGPQYASTAAWNTLLQGLLAAVLVGASTGILQAMNAGHWTWTTLATSAGSAVLASVAAYVQHAYVAPYLKIKGSIGGRAE